MLLVNAGALCHNAFSLETPFGFPIRDAPHQPLPLKNLPPTVDLCDAAGPGRFGNECVDYDLDPVLKLIRTRTPTLGPGG